MAERIRRSNPALNPAYHQRDSNGHTQSRGVQQDATTPRIRSGSINGRARRPKVKWANPILPECGPLIEDVISRGPATAKYEHVTALLAELLLTRETLDALCPKFKLPPRIRELRDMLERSARQVKNGKSGGNRHVYENESTRVFHTVDGVSRS